MIGGVLHWERCRTIREVIHCSTQGQKVEPSKLQLDLARGLMLLQIYCKINDYFAWFVRNSEVQSSAFRLPC